MNHGYLIKGNIPNSNEEGEIQAFHHDSPVSFYRQIYFEAVDNTLSTIRSRFDQPGFHIYQQLENLLLKTVHKENVKKELNVVSSFYGNDLDVDKLKLQLTLLQDQVSTKSDLQDVVMYLRSFSVAQQELLSELVIKVTHLILVSPATKAISERSFSAMKTIKSYLCSTMGQTDRVD